MKKILLALLVALAPWRAPAETPVPKEQLDAYVAKLREEYKADIDLMKLANEMVIDGVVPGDRLRDELVRRFEMYEDKEPALVDRKHMVPPV